jgi:hypothetical protein
MQPSSAMGEFLLSRLELRPKADQPDMLNIQISDDDIFVILTEVIEIWIA